jgi:AraC-like DNA-binding protein
MSKVPSIRFDTAALPPAERFAAWCHAMPYYDLSVAAGSDPRAFRIFADAWMLGEIVATATALSPVRFERSAAKIAADRCDHFSLLLSRQGGWIGDAGGRPITVGPGEIMIFDLSRPFEIAGAGSHTATLTLTRAAMQSSGMCDRDLNGLLIHGLAGRVLADHMMLLTRHLPSMDAGEAPAAVRGTLGLIGACIGANAETRSAVPPERDDKARHRASCYIDQNLGQQDLTSDKICKEIGLSRSSLYRAFAPLGGVADYVRARRLEAAHAMLENPVHDRHIADIAATLGFVSDAHFSRVFKERYRYSPRQVRDGEGAALRALAALIDTHASGEIFKAWLERVSQGSAAPDGYALSGS